MDRKLQAHAIRRYLEDAEKRLGPVPKHVEQAVDLLFAERLKTKSTAVKRRGRGR